MKGMFFFFWGGGGAQSNQTIDSTSVTKNSRYKLAKIVRPYWQNYWMTWRASAPATSTGNRSIFIPCIGSIIFISRLSISLSPVNYSCNAGHYRPMDRSSSSSIIWMTLSSHVIIYHDRHHFSLLLPNQLLTWDAFEIGPHFGAFFYCGLSKSIAKLCE